MTYDELIEYYNLCPFKISKFLYETRNPLKYTKDDHIVVAPSPISGVGIYTTKDIPYNHYVCTSNVGHKRFIPARYTNHSDIPNVKPLVTQGLITFRSIEDIKAGQEILVDYEDMFECNPLALQLFRKS